MSENVSVLDCLVYGLCESAAKDEQGDGIDISAGLLGQETSDWIRSVANGILLNKELILKQANDMKELEDKYQSLLSLVDDVVYYGKRNPSSSPQCVVELMESLNTDECE